MKVYINRQPIFAPWGGGAQFTNAFHKHVVEAGHELVPNDSMTIVPDVILLAGLDNDGTGISAEQAIFYKIYQPDVKIIMRVNENDARKGTSGLDDKLRQLAMHVDGTVFVSQWLRDYFMRLDWPCTNNTVIINGVNKDVFRPQPKLNNSKLNIVSHHWSNHVMKGFDIYEKIDEFVGQNPGKFSFTYIGRERRTFKHTNVVSPLFGKKLGEELGKYDVYVSASRSEPGPNHLLESLACEIPTLVHVDSGAGTEFVGTDAIYRDWDELKQRLIDRNIPTVPQLSVPLATWEECIKQYIDFMEKTCQT